MYQKPLKWLTIFSLLILAGFSLTACGGGGSDDGSSNVGSGTTPSLQSSTVTGVLTTQSSAVSRFIDLITPTSAVAVVPATIYLDNSSNPVFPNAQDRFTISNIANGDHSLYIQMGDGTEIEFPFRIAAGQGLDFGTMALADGQVRTFTGFNGYHFGWVDENGDGINDRFVDVDGDGICDLTGMPYQHPFGWSDDNSDGVNDRFRDVNGDGINDITGTPYVGMPGWADLNGDGLNDFFADADGDGVNDIGTVTTPYGHGYGWVDANGDGINDRFIDADGDGLNDLASGPFAGQSSCYGYMAGYQDANGDGIDDISEMPYRHGFGWVDTNGDGINDVFADTDGDGVNDYSGFYYDGGGYHMSQNFNSNMGMHNPDWPMGHGGGMMN